MQRLYQMCFIQVEDIDKKFLELEELKENNWEEKKVEFKKKNAKVCAAGYWVRVFRSFKTSTFLNSGMSI